MNRWTLAPVLILIWLAAAPAVRADAAPSTAASQVDISSLIAGLGDPDPTVRGDASLRLTSLGLAARPALAEALHAGSPEVRMQAGQILLRLPWAQTGDPDLVKRALSNYGEIGVDQRCERVSTLMEVPNGGG